MQKQDLFIEQWTPEVYYNLRRLASNSYNQIQSYDPHDTFNDLLTRLAQSRHHQIPKVIHSSCIFHGLWTVKMLQKHGIIRQVLRTSEVVETYYMPLVRLQEHWSQNSRIVVS